METERAQRGPRPMPQGKKDRKQAIREDLPHLFRHKFYPWSLEFFESTNRMNFLTAANQLGKSSIQICKCIDWATNVKLWPKLWPGSPQPNLFWYFYPDQATANTEWETKWSLYLPRGVMKSDPVFGWKESKDKRDIKELRFNSGVVVQFRTYSQKASAMQAGTVYAMFLDEEPLENLMPELFFRLSATDGYMHAAFTATIGQDYWRRVMEPKTEEEEIHASAWKKTVSLYDCMFYADGSPGPWTVERIEARKRQCATQAEIDKRIFGRFVLAEGRKVEQFAREKNTCEAFDIPKGWQIYGGVDPGSGGERGHPSAITFIAVPPGMRKGYVFRGWRGDYQKTTAGDTLRKFVELRGDLQMTQAAYDHSAADFGIIAERYGETFQKADKGQEKGTDLINLLFKNRMLFIFRGDPELEKLCSELSTLSGKTRKTIARDDFFDSLRYCANLIPWDWTYLDETTEEGEVIVKEPPEPEDARQKEHRLRKEFVLSSFEQADADSIDAQFDEMNDLLGV